MVTNESAIIRAKNMLIQQCLKNDDDTSESSLRNKLPRKHVRISMDPTRTSARMSIRKMLRNSDEDLPIKKEEKQWSGLIRSKSTDIFGSAQHMRMRRPSNLSQRSLNQENCFLLDNLEPLDLDSSLGASSTLSIVSLN